LSAICLVRRYGKRWIRDKGQTKMETKGAKT
jgi:hypothetical protein